MWIGISKVSIGEFFVEWDFVVGEFGGYGVGDLGVCGDGVVVVMMV